ncbi:MAG: SGNH/GDSL hydrolase family protein [Verrucomicrobiales bacterium]|nr:SGNH/GDSL hydrolase family protein [Verrucomicrobiales bacterium]
MTPQERASRYLAATPPAISGSGGHNQTYSVAISLVQGFGLTITESLPILQQWNSKCLPPWSEADLIHKLRDAESKQVGKPRGWLLENSASKVTLPARPTSPVANQPLPREKKPSKEGWTIGTDEQLGRLSKARPYSLEGLQLATTRGLLLFGSYGGYESYAVTDKSDYVLEARRVDQKPYPATFHLEERKSHGIAGTWKQWPVGILEAAKHDTVVLVEGIPDFLEAHYLAQWEQAEHFSNTSMRCAIVAMLSACPYITEEALPYFRGKRIRLFPHADKEGVNGAAKWVKQLRAAGAAKVDLFDFGAYTKRDDSPVKDLYDFRDLHPRHYKADSELWRILP